MGTKVFSLEVEGGPLETVEIAAFIKDNEFSPEEVGAIDRMNPGDTLTFGGGAAPLFTLWRENDEHEDGLCGDETCDLCEQVREDRDVHAERLADYGDFLYDCWKDEHP